MQEVSRETRAVDSNSRKFYGGTPVRLFHVEPRCRRHAKIPRGKARFLAVEGPAKRFVEVGSRSKRNRWFHVERLWSWQLKRDEKFRDLAGVLPMRSKTVDAVSEIE